MTKLFGIALLLTAAFLTMNQIGELDFPTRSPKHALKYRIEQDIEDALIRAGIPKSNGIHHVQIKFRSKLGHDVMRSAQPTFTTTNEGKIWIEIEVLDLPDEQLPALITQTSVFDLKTNNKISEFGQTYGLKDFGIQNPNSEKQ